MSKSNQRQLFDSEILEGESVDWETAAADDRYIAGIVFNRPLEAIYHYQVPDSLRSMIQPGQRVRASFGRGNQLITGYCVEIGVPAPKGKKLKSIAEIVDREPLLSSKMLDVTRWISERYLCAWGQVLESVIPAGVKKQAGTRLIQFYELVPSEIEKWSENGLPRKQQAVVNVLSQHGEPMRVDVLSKAADCGSGPLTALRKKGLIQGVRRRTSSFELDEEECEKQDDLILNGDQQRALDAIVQHLRAQKHQTILLHGVTGSGKTEVYIQAIREVVSYGQQAIVLVPEISLTPQTIRRFRNRFDSVAVLHSHLSNAERHWHWQRIASGEVQVVVGARSAVFAPTPNLGLIVIDEEHENTFKQETVPRYHAREVARDRTRRENIPLILGTATPTLESWQRQLAGEDLLISLPKRVQNRPLPPVVVVDVRNDPHISKGDGIGRALGAAMRAALADDGQVILFLNLRGYSPVVWCQACGDSVKCPNCDLSLTLHRDRRIVLCHCCEFQMGKPSHCPHCSHAGIRFFGIGTQRLEQEVRAKFPDASCLRMDSDSMKKKGSHDEALEAFRRGEYQILLGTQMIAKGLDFPNVTLVGVVDADTMLHQPDLRSAERTFQLLSQVAGRTGRGERGGRVVVQSSSPTEPAIQRAAEHDYLGFVGKELEQRREHQMPPFQRLARVIFRGEEESLVRAYATEVVGQLRQEQSDAESKVRVMGPAPAPITRLNKNYRYHIQLSAAELEPIQELWRAVVPKINRTNEVEFVIDVDPMNMR